MKVVILLEAGIPTYRNFLFEHLAEDPEISNLIVIHTGRTYDGSGGEYDDQKVRFVGSYRFGMHLGIGRYLRAADVVVASYNLRILTCWLPSLVHHRKWVFWGKGMGESENRIVLLLRKITSRCARRILVYNDYKRQELIKRTGASPAKVVAYQNTVRIDNPTYFGAEEKRYYLYFGRLQVRKGLLELVAQYAYYVNSTDSPKYRLRFVGDGPLLDSLKETAKKHGVTDYVDFFPGVHDDQKIAQHFRHAAAYVSPFNVGLAVVHSFAYGVPVLTCDKPQVGPEFHYLNQHNSIICSSVDDIAGALRKLEVVEHQLYVSSYDYYTSSLHHSIMLNKFTDTILQVGKPR